MPSFTKKAILESFLHLVGKKPIDKITVRDIVDDCGINRNTFYYYFQDIYAVLEELCRSVFEALPADKSLAETTSAFYLLLADFTKRHTHAARSLSLSLGFEGLERYFSVELDALISACYQSSVHTKPLKTELRLLRHALIGLCLDTMRGDCDPNEVAKELAQLLDRIEHFNH